MVLTITVLAVFGALGVTILCPVLAYGTRLIVGHSTRGFPVPFRASISTFLMEVIVPAHNEATVIRPTLQSIQTALNRFTKTPAGSRVEVNIHVLADGCTDGTVAVAQQFSGLRVSEISPKRGKWQTLVAAVRESKADWVIFADAGVLWPENFVVDVVQAILANPNALAVSPSYRPARPGGISDFLWRLERFLKALERRSGGPISVHGATVAYAKRPLQAAFDALGSAAWINDDVVVPLTLRSLYPQGIVLYPVGEISDADVSTNVLDVGRRKRMLLGNLQWIRALLPRYLAKNPVAGVVAGRRVFRLLWAYWLVFLLLAIVLRHPLLAIPVAAAGAILFVMVGSFRQLLGAAGVSLMTPLFLFYPESRLQRAWK